MRKNDILDRVYKTDLPSRAKQIMFYLINRANAEGTCFPSNKTIASDCGISTRTVQRTMKVLLEKGFIKKDSRFREQGGQTSNLFTLQIEGDSDKNNKKEVEVKENSKVEEIANKSVGGIKDSIEETETVTFLDYKQEDRVLETEEQLVNEDLPSFSTKESDVTKRIQKNNPTNTKSVKDDKLSNRSGCYPTFDHLNKNGYFEKHDSKLKDVLCHGVDDILYPP